MMPEFFKPFFQFDTYRGDEFFNWFSFFIVVLIIIIQSWALIKSFRSHPCFRFNEPAPSEIDGSISYSNLIVNFNTTMAKMQEMEKTLTTKIENGKNIYGSATLLATIKKLKTIDTSSDRGKNAVIYLFNNGKFRTQRELEGFLTITEQARYIEGGSFAKDEARLLAKRLDSTQVTNALILNPVFCPFATPIVYLIEVIAATIILPIGLAKGAIDTDTVAHVYNKINSIYLALFFISLVIGYFVFGGIHLAEEFETERELKEIYQKAGLKKPTNKMLMFQAGLYGANLFSIASLAKSLLKKSNK